MNVLLFLRTPNLDRLYASLFEELLARGHRVTVCVEKDRVTAVGAGRVLEDLSERRGFERRTLEPAKDRLWRVRRNVRLARDLLRYTQPVFADAPALRARALGRSPEGVRRFVAAAARTEGGRRAAAAMLQRVERALPVARPAREALAAAKPDVVLVSPLVSFGSAQTDWIAAADALGIPSVLPVASWDNLTNKGLIKRIPTRVIVWNDMQAAEATSLHDVPPERVVVTGAHSFDHWFERRPVRERAELLVEAGLPPDRPYLLYVCSSAFITRDETAFVAEWIGRIRGSSDPALRDAGILIRPHPLNQAAWERLLDPDRAVAVWPRSGELPTAEEPRALYFDSLHHAAAVAGVNTSAFVEAAIAGRRSYVLLAGGYAATQEGTLHFAQIADSGLVSVARDWDAHLDGLAAAVADPDGGPELARALESFARPRGLDLPAAPPAVDAIEAIVR